MSPDSARARGLTSTVVFPIGNIAPEGSVIKATAIDPSVVGADGVYRHRGPARVFTSERAAIRALKGIEGARIQPGDVLVLAGVGPMGTGMEETYQLTSALKFIPWANMCRSSPTRVFPACPLALVSDMWDPRAWLAGPSASCAMAMSSRLRSTASS